MAVSIEPRGEHPQPGQLQGLGDELKTGNINVNLGLAALGHLQQVAHHAKAGDIGAGMDPVFYHDIPGVLV